MKFDTTLKAFDRAALGQIGWEEALADFAALVGARVGQIAGIDRQGALVVNLFSGASAAEAADYLATGGADPKISPRTRAILRAPLLRTIVDLDFGTPQSVRRHPYYAGFLTRNDAPHGALIKLHDDGQRTLLLALSRNAQAGPFDEAQRHLIDDAAPRIRDAILTGLARERQQIDLVCNTLDHVTTAVLALNAQGQIVAVSPLAASVLDDGRHVVARGGRLLAHDAERQRALAEAVAATCRTIDPAGRCGVSLMIPAIGGGAMLVAAIAPLPLDTGGWLHTACCLIFLRGQTIARGDLTRYLSHHHLLTPSECDIALHLIEGRDARGIAAMRTVSEGTVRNQIKAVLAKTGYRRQLDLVAALRP